GKIARQIRRGHKVKTAILQHETNRDTPPWVGAMGHHQCELGEVQTYLVEVDRVLTLAWRRRARDPSIDRDRKAEFYTFRVDREVDRIVRRHVHVERHDPRQGNGLRSNERLETTGGLHSFARIEREREREAV